MSPSTGTPSDGLHPPAPRKIDGIHFVVLDRPHMRPIREELDAISTLPRHLGVAIVGELLP